MELARTVARLDRWLEEHAPGDFRQLAAPADPRLIAAATGNRFELHPDVRSWLALHDGSALDRASAAGAFVPTDFPLLGAVGMCDGLRDMEQEVARALEEDEAEFVVGVMADVRWLPVALNHTGGQLVVDHREGPGFGAVLELDPSIGLEGVKRWDSLSHLFDSVLDALVHGAPVATATGRKIVPRIENTGTPLPHVVWDIHYG
ncbi:hypothetical protein ACFU8Q_36830 [Streptomyces sp. NPDC057543]|uniref:hypothetical protein n=1 Tax=Streptomyces sp. NPDC057543 TaxID=3346163 RepID=UPI0036C0428B